VTPIPGALPGDGPDLVTLGLLAIIQGLTEFLPISSSGHLVLAQAALSYREPALVLDIALHVGTLAAVLVVYRRDLTTILRSLATREPGAWREPALLVLGTLPAVVVGLGFKSNIESAFHDVRSAAYGLFVTAGLLLAGEWGRRRAAAPGAETARRELGWGRALFVGAAQALAIWPGISRSGATIAAGMLCGLAPARAARFSFLLAIPAILGAAVLQLPDGIEQGAGGGVAPLLAAVVVAALVGWVALRLLLAFLGRGVFVWFAAYCVVLAGAALAVA